MGSQVNLQDNIYRLARYPDLILVNFPDPYVTVSYAKYSKPLFSTRIILGETEPTWRATTAVLVRADAFKVKERLALRKHRRRSWRRYTAYTSTHPLFEIEIWDRHVFLSKAVRCDSINVHLANAVIELAVTTNSAESRSIYSVGYSIWSLRASLLTAHQ